MFIFNLGPSDDLHSYDIEVYPNVFTCTIVSIVTGQTWYFEISDYRDDTAVFCDFMELCSQRNVSWVGYNNLGYDYPVIHYIYKMRSVVAAPCDIYEKSMSIINADHNAKFAHLVWESDHVIRQIDLFKIHHFDNQARSTGLKMLEFNMRMDNIEDLPFPVGTALTRDQVQVLRTYNLHDVNATIKFYHESIDQIRFRDELTAKLGKDFTNFNDTKIGKEYFIMELEKVNPGCCFDRSTGVKVIKQTHRDQIIVADILLPYISFNTPEFQRIHEWFKEQVITETKGAIKGVNCSINSFQFDFGTGGIHGSVDSKIIKNHLHEFDGSIIIDIDVASYYPNLAIANHLHPAHLGETFGHIYKDLYEQRKNHAKGTSENAMLKLALNGVYGDSNSKYSPFYDPQYTMSITINGQLLLCMLAEQLMSSPAVEMIQINTDGLTIKVPEYLGQWVTDVCTWWEQLTGLTLEHAHYSRMFIRDVNNYIAEYNDGSLKRKGTYEYELDWHQNHSCKVVAMAAEAHLVHGKDISVFIEDHTDVFDFFLRAKVPRSNVLEWGGEKVANIVRYYMCDDGKKLQKIMPAAGPEGAYKRANKLTDEYYNAVLAEVGDAWDERIHTKNKSVYAERRQDINTGWNVQLCNLVVTNDISYYDINYEWYIKEAEKLVRLEG